MTAPSSHRRGAVLVAALICLLVVVSIVTTMVAGTLARRRQLTTQRDARQALILVVAGHDRAVSRLSGDSSYDGETWEPTLNNAAGSVVITVERTGADRPRLTVAVTYPSDGPRPIRRSQHFPIPTNDTPSEGAEP